ncbi:MAG: hypothetical protein LBJ02_02565, partial [Bifidobacteriaceae bacterium]|nr:hypothetical protein [Bifidobacteriaceae bacterium]
MQGEDFAGPGAGGGRQVHHIKQVVRAGSPVVVFGLTGHGAQALLPQSDPVAQGGELLDVQRPDFVLVFGDGGGPGDGVQGDGVVADGHAEGGFEDDPAVPRLGGRVGGELFDEPVQPSGGGRGDVFGQERWAFVEFVFQRGPGG